MIPHTKQKNQKTNILLNRNIYINILNSFIKRLLSLSDYSKKLRAGICLWHVDQYMNSKILKLYLERKTQNVTQTNSSTFPYSILFRCKFIYKVKILYTIHHLILNIYNLYFTQVHNKSNTRNFLSKCFNVLVINFLYKIL